MTNRFWFYSLVLLLVHKVCCDVSGGDVQDSYPYRIHFFRASSNFVTTTSLTIDILVVAGGGAGGPYGGGGGGGGGVLYYENISLASGTYPIIVGAGGTPGAEHRGMPCPPSCTQQATSGGDSSFGTLFVAHGGGYGAQGGGASGSGPSSGGSGGGGATSGVYGASGVIGQGHDGGSGYAQCPCPAGGGGGAGGPGGNGILSGGASGQAGIGGIGFSSNISGQYLVPESK